MICKEVDEKKLQGRTAIQHRLYSSFVKRGSIVFDVGANVGNRINAFLKCGARVVAIEPQSDCADRLVKSYGSNPDVAIVCSAVGDFHGDAKLHSAKAFDPAASMSSEWMDATCRSGRFRKRNYSVEQKVKMTTLDRLIEEFGLPSFIKIDVEGYEERVLLGLSQSVSVLSFEWTPETPEQATSCMKRAENLGLTYFHISFGESMRFCHPSSISRPRMEDLIYSLESETILYGDIYASKLPLERIL